MKKVVFNTCHGGFGLSKLAAAWLASRGHLESIKWLASYESGWGDTFFPHTFARHSSLLVECIETLGAKNASGPFSSLSVMHVNDSYRIEEYDGLETIVEPKDIKWISAVHDPEAFDEFNE